MSKLINAPFARQGGKNNGKKKILASFPSTDKYDIYVEPFIGAGNIMLNAPEVKKMIGADTDTNIINAFNDMKKVDLDTIQEYNFRPSRKRFNEIRKGFGKNKDPKKRLYEFLYLKFNSYSGLMTTYTREGTTGKFFKKNFEIYQEKLKHIKIMKSDYKVTIKKYDSPTTFFYLDPPYMGTDTKEYETGNIDHTELASILRNIKGLFLLSHNDTEEIRELYKGFKIKRTKIRQPIISNDEYKKEILIMNY